MIDMAAHYVLMLALLSQSADSDPVARCRAAHVNDPPAHIACLEQALRAPSEARAGRSARSELGAEQVRRRSEDPATPRSADVQIVAVTYEADGLGLFRMADGQVWKETEKTPPHQRLDPNKTYAARIERGKVGGYRMHVEGVRRMIKLRRVE